ncbi:MAG: cytoplasmic protein [Planctomycetota bacterium]|nr:MAG: cytoplasmic protein [Planctomycetota bacterium]REJ86936.1 MAG: cytoplasmic protein [Planctomycetota bacterium]REK24937.1 MAG: cytoplasmic protein [Planctomycetota bacterium]REK48526.1 MAG: cytoplasmic protein [Planctomycetota bacterium]
MSESNPDHIGAHSHSSNHRDEVMRSEHCVCFYCLKTFPSSEISEWIDEIDGVGTTALCPHCGIDSVIGSASGYPLEPEFIRKMNQHWF